MKEEDEFWKSFVRNVLFLGRMAIVLIAWLLFCALITVFASCKSSRVEVKQAVSDSLSYISHEAKNDTSYSHSSHTSSSLINETTNSQTATEETFFSSPDSLGRQFVVSIRKSVTTTNIIKRDSTTLDSSLTSIAYSKHLSGVTATQTSGSVTTTKEDKHHDYYGSIFLHFLPWVVLLIFILYLYKRFFSFS